MMVCELNTSIPTGRRGRRRPLDLSNVATGAPGLMHRSQQVEAAKAALPPPVPVNADESVWNDPADLVNTRSPKQVRGHRRGDVVGHMLRRGTDVTRDHVEAAHRFRVDWDIAHIGRSGASALAEKVGGIMPAPKTGPGAVAIEQAVKQREVLRVLRFVGDAGVPILLAVVIRNLDINGWCATELERTQRKPDRKKEFGKLLMVLSRLCEFYGIDSRRDAANQARKELAQR